MIGNSASELKDGNLEMFTPKLLEKKHPQHLARFAANSKTHVTFPWITLFFVDSKGYIIECLTKIDCICVNTSIRFIAFINPLNRSREYALISKSGFIYEHSKNFTNMLMLERKYVKDNFIQEYLDIQDLKSLESKLLKLNLIQTNSKIPATTQARCIDFSLNTTSIYILYLSNTVSEYNLWNSSSNLFTVNEKTENTTEFISKSDQNNKTLLNPSRTSPSPSSYNFNFQQNQSLYNKAKVSLKAARLVLVLIVIFTQGFIVLSCNLSSVIYLSLQVKQSKDFEAFNNYNYLAGYLIKSGSIARSLDFEYKLKENIYFNWNDLFGVSEKLRNFTKVIKDYKKSSSPCPGFHIIEHKQIRLWDNLSPGSASNSDLLDLIDITYRNVILI